MEFITVEQFREQPKEVQKVFLDWWKPSIGDIFQFETVVFDNNDSTIGVIGSKRQIKITEDGKGKYRMPLFTEGQLREFIEDKLNIKAQFSIHFLTLDYVMITDDSDKVWIHTGTDDLLQAYWKVACMIAKEEVDG